MLVKIKNFVRRIVSFRNEAYYRRNRHKLKNLSPTIIASDCFGTFIYHNYGLKFNSPTINLFIGLDDFIVFVNDLNNYLSVELIEVKNTSLDYPVGSLTYNDKTVKLYFMHYETFENAKEKWNERKQRVDYSNICVIMTVAKNLTDEMVEKFNSLPYEHKMLVTYKNPWNNPDIAVHKIFNKKNYKPGEILSYKSVLSKKRNMDDIDYVSFINKVDGGKIL